MKNQLEQVIAESDADTKNLKAKEDRKMKNQLEQVIAESDADTKNLKAKDDRLKSIINNIIMFEIEKKEILKNISEIYKDAKNYGYDAKAIREVIKLSKMEENERMSREYLIESYKQIMGM